MNSPSLKSLAAALLCGVLLSLPGTFSARAHGPFDHSSQLTIAPDRLEIVVAMGSDAAQEFFIRSSLTATEIAALSPSAPRTPHHLPVELAGRIFEARVGGEALKASAVTVRTEGLDTLFQVSYPRPVGGTLALQATYFNGIEPMKHGLFIACDENLATLATVLLSRVNPSIEVPLPAVSSLTRSPSADTMATNPAQQDLTGRQAPSPEGQALRCSPMFIPYGLAAAAVLVITLAGYLFLRRTL